MSNSKVRAGPVESLRAAIRGDVFVPGEDGYDEARRAWNLAEDQRPAVVVLPESAAGMVRAVLFARSQGMRIAPQTTGHGAEPLEPIEGAMLVKTSRMRRVDIDPASRHGLAALAGSSPDVGVTGYALGRGIGWLARRYGLAANSVTAAEIVTPDGDLVRADDGQQPDLLWAVRGGGGIGVVTVLEMTLYPVSDLYAGVLFFPVKRASRVLHAWSWPATTRTRPSSPLTLSGRPGIESPERGIIP